MPIICRTYGCENCGTVFDFRHFPDDPAEPACPNPRCHANDRVQRQVSAPYVNRGAAPVTSVRVPDTATKRIDLAVKMALEDNEVTNLRSGIKDGEPAFMPIPTPPELANAPDAVRRDATARFVEMAPGSPGENVEAARSMILPARAADPRASARVDQITAGWRQIRYTHHPDKGS